MNVLAYLVQAATPRSHLRYLCAHSCGLSACFFPFALVGCQSVSSVCPASRATRSNGEGESNAEVNDIYPVPKPKAMPKSLRYPVPKPKAVPKSLRYPRSMDFQLEGVAGSAVLSASSGSNPPAASQSASSIAVTLTIDETHAAASLANTAAASQSSPAAVLEVTVFEDLTLASSTAPDGKRKSRKERRSVSRLTAKEAEASRAKRTLSDDESVDDR